MKLENIFLGVIGVLAYIAAGVFVFLIANALLEPHASAVMIANVDKIIFVGLYLLFIAGSIYVTREDPRRRVYKKMLFLGSEPLSFPKELLLVFSAVAIGLIGNIFAERTLPSKVRAASDLDWIGWVLAYETYLVAKLRFYPKSTDESHRKLAVLIPGFFGTYLAGLIWLLPGGWIWWVCKAVCGLLLAAILFRDQRKDPKPVPSGAILCLGTAYVLWSVGNAGLFPSWDGADVLAGISLAFLAFKLDLNSISRYYRRGALPPRPAPQLTRRELLEYLGRPESLTKESFTVSRAFLVDGDADGNPSYFVDIGGGRTLYLHVPYLKADQPPTPSQRRTFPCTELTLWKEPMHGYLVGLECSGDMLEPEALVHPLGISRFHPYRDGAVLDRSYDEVKRNWSEFMESGTVGTM